MSSRKIGLRPSALGDEVGGTSWLVVWRMSPRDIHMEAQYTHSDRGWAGPTNSRRTRSGLLAAQGFMNPAPCIQETQLQPTRTPTHSRSGHLQCNPAPRIYKGGKGTPN